MKILTVLVALAAAAFVSKYKLTVAVDDHLVGEDLIGCYELAGGPDEVVDPFRHLVCNAQRDFRFDSANCLMQAIKFTARDDKAVHVEQAPAIDQVIEQAIASDDDAAPLVAASLQADSDGE